MLGITMRLDILVRLDTSNFNNHLSPHEKVLFKITEKKEIQANIGD